MDPLNLVVSVSGFVMLVVSVVAIVWGRVRRVRVPRGDFRWASPPVVWLHAGPDFRLVTDAVQIMTKLGHPIGPVRAAPSAPEFLDGVPGIHILPDDGTLAILEASDGRPRAGACRLDATREIAEIRLSKSADLVVVLHEVLHSYDYDHISLGPSGHVMNPSPERRGLDVRGLEAEASP